jgi:YgiT-type zinc finger domain-containing protein
LKPAKKNTVISGKIPVITQEMIEETAIEIAKRRYNRKQSPVKGVKDINCPSCGNSAMSYADDQTFDVTLTGERILIPNLTGLKCSKCGESGF